MAKKKGSKHKAQHAQHPSHHKKVTHPKKKPVEQYVFGAVIFVVLVAVIAGLIYLASKSGESRFAMQSKVAATVNGEEITTEYLDEQYARVPEMYREFITKGDLLNQSINEVLLLQEAKKQGVAVSTGDVQAEINDAMATAGVSEEELEERLAEQNITREYLEELYQKQLTITALLEKKVFGRISLDPSEIEQFYNSRIHAMHVLVDTGEEAEDIISELKSYSLREIESAFGDIAAERSTDPSAAQNRGDLGEFSRGQMVAPFEAAAFALDEYAFTAEPVRTQFGYHVILRLPKTQSLEQQSAEIEEALLTQKKAQAVPMYIDQLRSGADIQVFYVEEPAAPAE